MPRFVFRADAALELRRRREDLERRACAEAQAAFDRATAALENIRALLEASRARQAAEYDPARLTWHRNWIHRLHLNIARHERAVHDRKTTLEAAQARLREARQAVRALEKLRGRQLAAWQVEEQRNEQKALDWLGCVAHALRSIDRKESQ